MNIHEYQAKEILKKYGVAVPGGKVAFTADEAFDAAKELGGDSFAVKAQIHAGGRGKGGGVKIAKSLDEVKKYASEILGMNLVTHQTGPEGKIVRKVYIEQGTDIDKEFYLGMVIDRATERVTFMVSTEGGMEIEEVAAKTPEKIIKEAIDPAIGLQPFQARKLAFGLGMNGKTVGSAVKFMMGLYDLFIGCDCSLAEINPLVLTKEGEIIALDAKINLDDSGLPRHKELAELRDIDEEDARELEARKWGLTYISLDGTIGCMVNGAGLAMATMDIIKHYGAAPANFLDVGGGAGTEQVTEAFKLIVADEKVKGILVNIFGGIMRCDIIAEGIVEAARVVNLKVPLVVRLKGTNVDIGKKILADSGLEVISADTMAEAAKKIVEAIR